MDSLPDGRRDDCDACINVNLGRAFDALGMRDSAIVAFERYVDAPWPLWLDDDSSPFLAATYERLGELYEAKARANYTRFIALWKDADPDLQPRVRAARARLARFRAQGT